MWYIKVTKLRAKKAGERVAGRGRIINYVQKLVISLV